MINASYDSIRLLLNIMNSIIYFVFAIGLMIPILHPITHHIEVFHLKKDTCAIGDSQITCTNSTCIMNANS